jgi:hypothetical protein
MAAILLEADVIDRVADEDDRRDERGDRDACRPGDEHVARSDLGGEPSAERGGHRDTAVPGGLVEAEGKAAPLRADEVDLHHYGHRPGEALVDAEEEVGGDDPGPARGYGDEHRHRQRDHPARDQQTSATEARGEPSGAEVGERLRKPEGDDERQHRGGRADAEVVLADQR